MKIAAFTILDDKFVMGWKVFMKSFLHYNPWFKLDFIVLDLGLSPKSKKEMEQFYPNIIYRKPQYGLYRQVNFRKTHDKLKATYYFLDAFCQYDYDKIVSFDTGDMVVLDSVADVFYKTSNGISACKAYNVRKDNLVNDTNAGLFVVGKKYLNKRTYNDLLQIAKQGYSMPEQKTMNLYFKGIWEYLSKRFNIEKRMKHTKRQNLRNVLANPAVLHFVGLKPWECHERCKPMEKRYSDLEQHWWKWYKKC